MQELQEEIKRITGGIKMKREDLRKVKFENENDEIVQGYFHQWITLTEKIGSFISPILYAIVELEDGNVMVVGRKNIKFIS